MLLNNEVSPLSYTFSCEEILGWHHVPTEYLFTACELLQEKFKQRPPVPNYDSVWSVSTVLEFMSPHSSLEDLLLKQLSKKLAMVLALTNPSRSSDVHTLDMNDQSIPSRGCRFLDWLGQYHENQGHRGCIYSLNWTTGLDYWTHFSVWTGRLKTLKWYSTT